MAYQYIKGAVSCSDGTEYTGSFIRLQALGQTGGADNHKVVLTNIQFGSLAEPESATTIESTTGTIELSPGATIEGPIYAFKTGTSTGNVGAGILAYYTNKI